MKGSKIFKWRLWSHFYPDNELDYLIGGTGHQQRLTTEEEGGKKESIEKLLEQFCTHIHI